MATVSSNGASSKLSALQKSFQYTYDSDLQKHIVDYCKILRHQSYTKLLQDNVALTEDRNTLIGELRMLQRLIQVLEPKVEIVDLPLL
jgi:hypothetical protein